jgi:hypothetical protein
LARVNSRKIDGLLLLLFTVALVLATSASDEVFLLSFAGKGFALWELLACALVWLPDMELLGDFELLLCDLGEVLIVALGLDLRLGFDFRLGVGSWLRCPCLAIGIDRWWDSGVETFLLLFLCNGLASFLVSELGITGLAAPTMTSLLWVIAYACLGMPVIASATSTSSARSSASTVAAFPTSRWAGTIFWGMRPVVGATSIAITESSFVARGLFVLATTASCSSRSTSCGSVSGGIALASPRCGLVNGLGRRLGFAVRILLRVVSQQVVKVLRSNAGHVDQSFQRSRASPPRRSILMQDEGKIESRPCRSLTLNM